MSSRGAQRPVLDRIRLELQVALHRTRLDAMIAAGADPAEDPALALRAYQLTELSTRRAIANTLRNLIDASEEPPEVWGGDGPRPPLRREDIHSARGELLRLSDRLTRQDVVCLQAVALAALLVWDSASPMYTARADATVAQSVDTALDTFPPSS